MTPVTRERLSRRVRSVPPSGIRRFFDIAATMPDVLSLGIGEPDFMTPASIRAAGQASIDVTTAYTSNSGLIELRIALAEHLEQMYGVRYDPENELLMTVGVSEALLLVMLALLDAGDEVIVPEPCFSAYTACIQFADADPVLVPTFREDAFQVDPARIEAAITPRTRALLIGYPCNPTGAVLSRERMQQIMDIAEAHDLIVISDEIYDRLVFGTEHVCAAGLRGAAERTVLLGGFSKAYAMTGWRLGWMAGPAEITNAVRKMHQYAIMSAPTMSQYAGLEALHAGEPDVQAMVAEYDRRRQFVVSRLNAMGLPTLLPQGAFYAFPYVGGTGMDSETFAERVLQEAHVAVVPGGAFGPSGEGYVRICYASSMEKLTTAMDRIEQFMQTLKL